ncbi:MAG TPA: hypothetical protein VIV11_11905, partial [Kofleriaceae bacterium]
DTAGTRVGTQDPQDRESAFYSASWLATNRPAGAAEAIAPNAVGRFTWTMVAPEVEASTTYDETFQLVQEGVTWFGPKHTLSIAVHPRDGTGSDGDGDGDGDGASSGCSTSGQGGIAGLVFVLLAISRRGRRAAARSACRPRQLR